MSAQDKEKLTPEASVSVEIPLESRRAYSDLAERRHDHPRPGNANNNIVYWGISFTNPRHEHEEF